MNSNHLLALGLAVVVAGYFISQAYAQHHPLHEHFYQHWRQPGSGASCCNARITYPGGAELGDCEPTDAKLVAGRWYARLPKQGPYIEVPDSKIIREINPTADGTDAHLCWSPSQGVICFVPPFGGG